MQAIQIVIKVGITHLFIIKISKSNSTKVFTLPSYEFVVGVFEFVKKGFEFVIQTKVVKQIARNTCFVLKNDDNLLSNLFVSSVFIVLYS